MRIISLVFLVAACAATTPPHSTVGSYKSGGDCHTGTPENPTCTSHLSLAADGTGEFIGDDIVERVTWKRSGDDVDVMIGTRTLKLRVADDGTLVDANGITWARQP